MKIKTTNDGKGRLQSWEAEIIHDGSDSMGFYHFTASGFGITEYEAIQNLIQQRDNIVKNMKRLSDNLNI